MTTTSSIADLSVSVPRTWARRRDLPHGVVVAARAPSMPASGVRPEIVLHARLLDPPDDDRLQWRHDALSGLAASLVDFALEDDDVFDLEDREVHYHRWAHRVGTADVLCDQWSWALDETGLAVTLTCSAAREDYPDWCDVFEAVAATVDLARH